MSAPKTVPKKLRGGPTIPVDEQVIRWRQKMRKLEIKLGKNMLAAERKAERQQLERETTHEKLKKKKWFE